MEQEEIKELIEGAKQLTKNRKYQQAIEKYIILLTNLKTGTDDLVIRDVLIQRR